MEYQGNGVKRMALVYCEADRSGEDLLANRLHPIGFMYQNGNLLDFLDGRKDRRIQNVTREKLATLTPLGNEYYAGDNPQTGIGYSDQFVILRMLPSVYDDKRFAWKRNKKYSSLEATLHEGEFEYLCIYKETGDAVIDVKYKKCDNKHRNKVTIARIDVYSASNDAIIAAIQQWKTEFTADLNAA